MNSSKYIKNTIRDGFEYVPDGMTVTVRVYDDGGGFVDILGPDLWSIDKRTLEVTLPDTTNSVGLKRIKSIEYRYEAKK